MANPHETNTLGVAAAGYGGINASPLARPYFVQELVARNWPDYWLTEVVETSTTSEIFKCNDVATFTREPRAPRWRDLEINQPIDYDDIDLEAFDLCIRNQAYAAFKIDSYDVNRPCDWWPKLKAALEKGLFNNLALKWQDFAIHDMILSGDPRNRGRNAGPLCNIDLGTPANPIVLTPDNILAFLTQVQQVFIGARSWDPGNMYAIGSPRIMQLMQLAPQFANAMIGGNCADNCSSLISGRFINNASGFDFYYTDSISSGIVGNTTGEWLIFGRKGSYGFYGDVVDNEVLSTKDSFGWHFKARTLFGGGALDSEAMVAAFVKPTFTGFVP